MYDKLVGSKVLIDPNTGEELFTELHTIGKYGDRGFSKIWFDRLRSMFWDHLGSSEKVFFYLVCNIDIENCIDCTYSKIAKEIDCSEGSVRRAMRLFLSVNFLIRLLPGRYMVNPSLLFKGYPDTRTRAVSSYDYAKMNLKRVYSDDDLEKSDTSSN